MAHKICSYISPFLRASGRGRQYNAGMLVLAHDVPGKEVKTGSIGSLRSSGRWRGCGNEPERIQTKLLRQRPRPSHRHEDSARVR